MEDSGLPGCQAMSICKLLPMLVPLKYRHFLLINMVWHPRTLEFSATTL